MFLLLFANNINTCKLFVIIFWKIERERFYKNIDTGYHKFRMKSQEEVDHVKLSQDIKFWTYIVAGLFLLALIVSIATSLALKPSNPPEYLRRAIFG